jgi:hypothetical protein
VNFKKKWGDIKLGDNWKTVVTTNENQQNTTDPDEVIEAGTPDKNNEIVGDTALYTEPGKVKVHFTCKAKDGHEIKQGETGYDECLQKVKNDNPNSKDPSADIKVNFGN